MEAPTRVPGYDLFKLIVAIVLLILALILMWVLSPTGVITATPFPLPTTTETLDLSPTPSPPPFPTETLTPDLSPTPPPPVQTQTPASEFTPTLSPAAIVTPTPSPTATPRPQITTTPGTGTPVADACEAAVSRSRLQVGKNAMILRRLNFRSSPGIRENWLWTNLPGTQIKIVGGPECVPYWTGAYLWWQIQLPDGRVGWSAEGSLHGSFYFIEPK